MSVPACDCAAHRTFRGLRECISADVRRFLNKSPDDRARGDRFRTKISAFAMPEVFCLFLHRCAHLLHGRRFFRLAGAMTWVNFFLHKVTIPSHSCIGPGCLIAHPPGVMFSGTAGQELTLYSLAVCCPDIGNGTGDAAGSPRLGDRVSIGAHAVVLGPVTIGDDVRVAYGVRVVASAPPRTIVVSSALRQPLTPMGPARPGSPVTMAN